MTDSVQPNPSDELVETYRQILVKVARLVRRSPTDDGGYFFADVPAMVERELSILRAAAAAPAPDRDTGEIADRIGAKQHPAWSSYRRARKGEQADEYGYVDEPMPAGDRNTHTMVTFTAGDGGTSLRTLTWGEVVPLVFAELAAGVGGVPAEPQPADHAIDVHRVPGPGLHPDYYAACICGWRGTKRIASDLARSEGTEHLAGAVPQDRKAGT